MTARGRKLAPEEAALWARVIETVKPLEKPKAPLLVRGGTGGGGGIASQLPDAPPPRLLHSNLSSKAPGPEKAPAPKPSPALKKKPVGQETLDGSWDRRLSRGLVAPEFSIDLHGYTLSSAYARLDRGIEQALARGDRVLLLVTGKPPGPESERPHKRGAIRAAVGDWIGASRFADRIAAVRGAHPRHGGTGALYIVLRRPKIAGNT